MSEKNLPDRASEFDDEIPTYSPSKATTSKDSATANAYQRAGRVAPQSIAPDSTKSKKSGFAGKSAASDAAKLEESAKAKEAAAKAEVAKGTANLPAGEAAAQTTAFAAARDHSAPLASDAPTTSYDPPRAQRTVTPEQGYADDDFAPSLESEPTTVLPAAAVQAAEPTQVLDPSVSPAPVAASAVAPGSSEVAPVVQTKRGTMDFGLLLLRIAMSAYLLLDSLRVFFNLGAGGGLNQLEQDFSSYNAPNMLAIGIPALELAAGVFLLFGLLTPVAAAVGTGAMTFMLGHFIFTAESLAIFDMPEKVWLGIMLVAGTLTLQFTGPGVISFDISRSWAKRPLYSSWIFAALSIIGAVALWWFGAGVNPLA